MKRLLIFLFSLFIYFPGQANHIVGGEIELVHLNGFNYRVNLIQYFDLAQNVNPGPEPFIYVYTFRKRDNAIMRIDTLSIFRNELVNYTNILCVIAELRTLKTTYSRNITLSPDLYNDPEGYYMVWERCCRNFTISNILNPGGTGMTYYLEFPPVVRENVPFVNSSPQLFPPLSDYACINQLYYVDFAGSDVDGDSIAYSLTTPSNSSALVAVPIPNPAPHPTAQFRPGITVNNMVPGNPALNISNKGFITVKPSSVGLYVFSVKAEEYRNKVKIGEVRRDFQLLVVDGCEPPEPPKGIVKVPGVPNFNPETDVLSFTVGQESKCFEFLVTDESAFEEVSIRAVAVNFDADVSDILSISSGVVFPGRDTLTVEVCLGRCPYVQNGPFLIDLIVADNACPLPQLDTVRMSITVEPPTNRLPVFTVFPTSPFTSAENQVNSFTIVGQDPDLDMLELGFTGRGFNLQQYGFSVQNVSSVPGRIEKRLVWDTNCELFDFGLLEKFVLDIGLDDADECQFDSGVARSIEFNLTLPINTPPTIGTNLTSNVINTPLSGIVSFEVISTDADNDQIVLSAQGVGFSMSGVGASFIAQPGAGTARGTFSWDMNCAGFNYTGKDSYTFVFSAEDLDKCKEPNMVSTEVTINLVIPENTAPEFVPISRLDVFVNQANALEIPALDQDNDFITINLARNVLFDNFQFTPASGQGAATAVLNWTPDCSLLGSDFSARTYRIEFVVADNRCPVSLTNSILIDFVLQEPLVDGSFLPANAFSPNGDGINDQFTLSGIQDATKNLPPDLCENVFESIHIYDRNGLEVFSSTSREFSWNGGGRSHGTYFYLVKYTFTQYKGYVTLIK